MLRILIFWLQLVYFSGLFEKIILHYLLLHTCMKIVQAPTERKLEEEIIALKREKGQLLCIDDGDAFPMYKIQPQLLAGELICEVEDVESELLTKLPVKACLSVEQEEITSIFFLD